MVPTVLFISEGILPPDEMVTV